MSSNKLPFKHLGHHNWRTDFGDAVHTKEVGHYLQKTRTWVEDVEPIAETKEALALRRDSIAIASFGGEAGSRIP